MSQDHVQEIATIMRHPAFKVAIDRLGSDHERTIADIITLTEIPAPPFKEDRRASAYLAMLRAHGLEDVEQDEIGNVMGLRRGAGNGTLIVVAAHLDTVFPEGTDVTVRREGTRLYAPGVGDDTRSLAVLLAFIRAMDAAGIRTRNDILFVGDVGEEGLGDLRGIRHLFMNGRYSGKIDAFITVDSPQMDKIVVGGVGSKRYSIRFKGPGGHSFKAFGIVNPMYAMAHVVAELGRIEVPETPRTTFCASIVGGGTSVNAVPEDSWVDIDLRSESAEELAKLDLRCREIVAEAVARENATRSISEGAISVEIRTLGERPAGSTPKDADIVRYATAASQAAGFTPRLEASSTDANIPMSLGIPAIRIGSGGAGGRAHSLGEWIDVEKSASVSGMIAGLASIVAVAGLVDG
ncbi:MAG TPA: M20/M25/M40 family metallo-hydrolase [Ensifer sp.]|jgi:acetylornithine deacetylase/succinyl-diaminopimelate desuccinylase-like protein|uniref:M20/M25/M40 family metallo-hydrolase n=1 Tax=Ensifer sp. TaxID=1872086 RepID=UPI002E146447|nr:M20/M25/M40 family metallo-hydrolase [Ensifer sp.]